MGGGDSSSVGVRQSHPEAGLRLREENCPKSATSPFPTVIAQDNLPPKRPVSLPLGARKEQTGGEAPGGLQFPSSLHPSLWAPPFLVPPSVSPTTPLNSLLTPLPAPHPSLRGPSHPSFWVRNPCALS